MSFKDTVMDFNLRKLGRKIENASHNTLAAVKNIGSEGRITLLQKKLQMAEKIGNKDAVEFLKGKINDELMRDI